MTEMIASPGGEHGKFVGWVRRSRNPPFCNGGLRCANPPTKFRRRSRAAQGCVARHIPPISNHEALDWSHVFARSESDEAIQLFSATNGGCLLHHEHRRLWVS